VFLNHPPDPLLTTLIPPKNSTSFGRRFGYLKAISVGYGKAFVPTVQNTLA
jgi:hypothetical protein